MQEESNLIHLDFAKPPSRFVKKRRTFNKLAKFISYDFGNVKCYVYNVIENLLKIPSLYQYII
jgi:hypothetical protein